MKTVNFQQKTNALNIIKLLFSLLKENIVEVDTVVPLVADKRLLVVHRRAVRVDRTLD